MDTLCATRRYLESLSAVHEFARSNIDNSINEARASFEAAIKKYVTFSNASAIGLTAFATSTCDPLNEIAILLDWDDVRVKLSKRNRNLKNLSKYVVSSVVTY